MPPDEKNNNNVCAMPRECITRFMSIEADTKQLGEIKDGVKEILTEQKRINGTVSQHNLVLFGKIGMPGLVHEHKALEIVIGKLKPKVLALWVLFGIVLSGLGFVIAKI